MNSNENKDFLNSKEKNKKVDKRSLRNPKIKKNKINLHAPKKFKDNEKEKIKVEKSLLEVEVIKLKLEIEKNNKDFTDKIQELTLKAKEEIAKHKENNSQKLNSELEEIKKYGIQKFFEAFLMPLNNLELAIKAGVNQENPAVQNYVKGFEMLFNQMQQTFNDFGIQKIEPNINEEFNPELHQIFETEDNLEKKDLIIKVKSNGYKLHERVIKPALVIVGK